MRSLIIAVAGFAAAALIPSAAPADPHDGWRQLRDKERECARDLYRADSPREHYRRLRECRREIAQARRQLIREQYRDWDRDWERRWDRDRGDDWDDDWDDDRD